MHNKTQTPYFLPVMENEFKSFTTIFSNMNVNDLYWTKISIKPWRFFQKFRKNTRICIIIISIITLILKFKGFIETIINNFFFFWNYFETVHGFNKKIKFLVVSMKLLWFQIVIFGQNWLKMRFRKIDGNSVRLTKSKRLNV